LAPQIATKLFGVLRPCAHIA